MTQLEAGSTRPILNRDLVAPCMKHIRLILRPGRFAVALRWRTEPHCSRLLSTVYVS